jgi:uncharacterized protein YbaR (Trm112 family)
MLPKELLDVLCCPQCKGDILYEPEKNILTCKKCNIIYPVRNNIPMMLIDEKLRTDPANEPS